MFPIIAVAASGIALWGGAKLYTNKKSEQPTLVARLSAYGPLPQKITTTLDELDQQITVRRQSLGKRLAQIDDRYQIWVQTWLDPLFGDKRHEQIDEVAAASGSVVLSELEKENNRLLVYVAGFTGLATLTTLYLPAFVPICLPVALVISWPFFKRSYHALFVERRLRFDVLGSINLLALWFGGYYFTGGFAFILLSLSTKLIYITQDRSHKNLVNIFGQQPRRVWVRIDGVEVELPFAQLQVGDTLVVSAGQMVPADGVISEGYASIDQQRLTGEAQPIEKNTGDRVLTATIVLAGKIYITVEKTGEATVAAQIGEMLNNTTSYQMAVNSKAEQLSDQGVLPTLIMAGLARLLVNYGGAVAITNASFGLNARITGPIAMLNYLNLVARRGILVKDGRSLELLHEIDTVVFDKTGTLTLEQPQVIQVHICNDMAADQVLRYAAAVEQRQSHPVAHAILGAAKAQGLVLPAINDAGYEMGYGIKATIEDQLIRVGSDRFMALENVPLPAAVADLQTQCQAHGHSLVMVAVGAQLAGAIELAPTIRPEAKAVIEALHKRKITLYIISGDQEQPTRRLAEALGIDHYFANTLPADKARLVEQLQEEGRSVCFVGDGINDSIALKKAKVSISLRGATTIATDTAQIVLMDATLQHLPGLFDLAREFDRNLQANFAAAIIPGVIICGGVFFAHLGVAGSIALYNIGLLGGMGIAMLPLVTH